MMSIARKSPAKTAEPTTAETFTAPKAEIVSPAAVTELMKPINEIQEKVRATTEQGIEHLRSHYAALKDNAEAATGKLEESLAAAHSGAREFNVKVVDLVRTQTDACFTHLQALFGVKTLGDAMKLQQDFAKAQFDAAQANAKQFADLAKKIAEDVSEPVKASFALSFKR
jgi:phasin